MDNTVYITMRNARLSKDNGMLVISGPRGEKVKKIGLHKIRDIVCFASAEMTSSIRNSFFKREIDVVFVTEKGKFIGRLDGFNSRLADVRFAQYKAGPDKILLTAGAIVAGKIDNSRVMLLRWRNKCGDKNETDEMSRYISSMRAAKSMIVSAENQEQLMGIEGFCSTFYFKAFSFALKQDLGFKDRNRRPPKDPVNALLSFAYMILYNKVLTAVNRAGLDPALSCLHSIAPRRMSLALDLMEEFRAIICDSAVLKLVNTFSVGKDDFFKNSFDGGVTMTSLAISRLVDAIETRLSDSTLYPRLSRKLEYRNIIQWQAWHYRDCVMDEEKNYEPFKIR